MTFQVLQTRCCEVLAQSRDARAKEAAEPLAGRAPSQFRSTSPFLKQRARQRGAWLPCKAAVHAGARGNALMGTPHLGLRQNSSAGRGRRRSRGRARCCRALHRALRRRN